MLTELKPVYDSRKSFYGKAHVKKVGKDLHLISYNTHVATIKTDEVYDDVRFPIIHGFYSATTLRHIKDFLYQNGFRVGTKSELTEWYLEEPFLSDVMK